VCLHRIFASKLDLIEQFHGDFKDVVSSYLAKSKLLRRKPRVFVFVDDLDRCEPPKSADLVQGLNLLISDSPEIVFVIGIDRSKVAAAIAVKYKDLLPYVSSNQASRVSNADLTTNRSEPGESSFNPNPGLELAHSFLEKFIQITFLVPRMTPAHLPAFFVKLKTPVDNRSLWKRLVAALRERLLALRQRHPDSSSPLLAEDGPAVYDITKALLPSTGFNPRRLKQFLNVFRLQRLIAFRTGRLQGVTLNQIGKFVALVLRWPDIVLDLGRYPELLGRLEKYLASSQSTVDPSSQETRDGKAEEAFQRWVNRPELKTILLVGSRADQEMSPEWSLQSFNVNDFLNLAPVWSLQEVRQWEEQRGREQ
jgi:KAP family P-loop domain